MNTIDFTPKLSPRFLVYIRNYLLDSGVDPKPVFLQSGIEDVTESEYAFPLSSAKVVELTELASVACKDSLLGFNMATHFHYESSALIVLAMLAAPTVEAALRTLSHFDQYVDTGIATAYDFGEKKSTFTAELLGMDCMTTGQINEYLITFTVYTLNTATRKKMPINEVHFQHDRSIEKRKIETFFDAPVIYKQSSNRLHFDSSHLRERMLTSNELLYDILQNALKTYFYAESKEHGFIDLVCRELMYNVENSTDKDTQNKTESLENVAKKLAISARTLRRRLKEEGYNFQQVKNLARERQAKYYLASTRMTLSEIAFALGFSELSAFSRAFKGWTDTTPQEYRSTVHKLILA